MVNGLKALQEYRKQQQGVNVNADELLNIIEKELKALDIIKQKKIDVSLYDFDYQYGDNSFRLTQEEYDLLKEVLR